MLAISRALLTNPRLLIMDEPTEGLAPVIVAQVEEMLVRLGEEGDMAVLVIEQNIGVATAVSEKVAIMVNGRINRVDRIARGWRRTANCSSACSASAAIREAEPASAERSAARAAGRERRAARGRAPVRIYVSNPTPPTRWSQPVPIARIEAGARTTSAGVSRLEEAARPRATRSRRAARTAGRAGRRHARHQGGGTSLHPRPRRGERAARAPRRRLDQRQAGDVRRRRRRKSRSTIGARRRGVFGAIAAPR